jgi:hypothetical protein
VNIITFYSVCIFCELANHLPKSGFAKPVLNKSVLSFCTRPSNRMMLQLSNPMILLSRSVRKMARIARVEEDHVQAGC